LNREGARDARTAASEAKTTDIKKIAKNIVAAAIKVHIALGPGLLESAYQRCMEYDLKNDGMHIECEIVLPIRYGEISIDAGYRIDMIV
jgi:GxxExxY protein